jgi:hypothetical protein
MDRRDASTPERKQIFAATARRPADYPVELPFVPNLQVEVGETAGERTLTWPAVDRPLDLLQQLIGACASAGWSRVAAQRAAVQDDEPTATTHRARFRSGTLERRIEAVQAGPFSFVTLSQKERT